MNDMFIFFVTTAGFSIVGPAKNFIVAHNLKEGTVCVTSLNGEMEYPVDTQVEILYDTADECAIAANCYAGEKEHDPIFVKKIKPGRPPASER